jgi:uncharacterized protein (TIGR00255 family)
MIRSMTGYGEAERETAAGTLRVEVRTVNHRHLNVNFRLPNALARWEGELREWLRAHFARGHVNCSVRLEPPAGSAAARGLRIDEERVQAYLALFRDMGTRLGVAGEPDLALITRFNDVIVRDEGEAEQVEVTPEELRAALDDAARQNLGMREDEGRRLHDDLEGRLRAIDAALRVVEERAPARLVAERDRLRAPSRSWRRASRWIRTGWRRRWRTSPSAGTSTRSWCASARTTSSFASCWRPRRRSRWGSASPSSSRR